MVKEKWLMVLVFTCCVLGLKPSCINGETDPSDASALNSMYSSLNSPGQLSQWTASGGDPCGQSWTGITCLDSRITTIKLPSLGLSGSVGFQLSSMTSVTELDMSNNNLGGDIPYQLPPNLTKLNLAYNQYIGNIPYSISLMTALTYINIGHNQLQGQVGDLFGRLTSLTTLDISFNTLTGDLPESFSSLSSINSMYLQNNQLTGTIDVLATLPLRNLNIGNNRFTGWIPEQLKGIDLQSEGNAWSSGPAPPPPPGTPPATQNQNHRPGSHKSPSSEDPSREDSSGEKAGATKSGIGGGAIAGIVVSLLLVGALVAFFLFKRRSKRSSLDIEKPHKEPFTPLASIPEQDSKDIQSFSALETKTSEAIASITLRPPPAERIPSFNNDDFSKKPVVKKMVTVPANVLAYSIADLQMATGSFTVDNLLGEGSFGRVYRACFDDGRVNAVKKIDSSALPGEASEDFTEIVSKLSQLNHPNLSELLGYCLEHGQHLLVYDFYKNGSLHELLHLPEEYSKPLIWNTRVKVALGTARALEYLHEVSSPSVVHKNIKSTNILLDGELNPHLSDSGLASFFPNADQLLSLNNEGSGYSAPEVDMSGQYSLKSDVYSFGVVMLELLTGRRPFDSTRPRSEQSLVRWATPQLHDIDALGKMVDPVLDGLYPVKSLSRFADVIALCVQAEPEFRPPMSEVVQALVVLVQRANMSKRTISIDKGLRADIADS